MNMEPGGIVLLVGVGLVAGWLAGYVMKGRGYGVLGDLVLGIVGAYLGGWLVASAMPGTSVGLIGSIVVALIGSVTLVALARTFGRRQSEGEADRLVGRSKQA